MNRHISWESVDNGEGDILRSQIADILKQEGHNPKKREDHKRICAEIHVISRLTIDQRDRIVLLASDNMQGRVCAEMVKKTIIDAFNSTEAEVEIRRIEGLQVLDAKKLREQGLKNLVKVVLDYLDNDDLRYRYDIILNPTGGFKGVVPFVTILGMLYGRRSVYLFEFAEELINLPPLPFSFDIQLYNRVRPALNFINQEIAVTEDAFLSKIINYVPEERDRFMSFTEPFDDKTITLSPLAYCLLKVERTSDSPILAESALADLQKISGESALVLKRLIKNSVNPLWRENRYHTCVTTDLIVLKQGRTSERIAGFMRDKKFLITNIFANHDDYDANIGKYQREDFKNTRFLPYIEEEYLGVDEDDLDAVILERDKLLIENKNLKQQLREQTEAFKNLETSAKRQVDEYIQELEEKKRHIQEAEIDISVLKDRQSAMSKNIFTRLRYLLRGKI
ncbi:MAG: putative CRISPR-associated protein [Dysgonamonadaceae bacterium]|jgi:putative CRISPR-associated protein (TIGR02619 family)|nr:putative CRISPR-associated protein [Dysgonamonadaceae bacterium]